MARAPKGLPSSRHKTAPPGPEASVSSGNWLGSLAANPATAATKAAKIVPLNPRHTASPAPPKVLEQGFPSAAVVRSADAEEAILALRQSPPELVVFLKGPPAALLVSLLSKTLGGQPAATADGVWCQSPGAIFRDGADALTEREREVAKLAASGARNKEIAWQLRISEGTVKLHLFRAYRKLQVTNRVGLALAFGTPHKN